MKVRKKATTRMQWSQIDDSLWKREVERAVRKADRKYLREARWFRDADKHGRFLQAVSKIEKANFKKLWEQLCRHTTSD